MSAAPHKPVKRRVLPAPILEYRKEAKDGVLTVTLPLRTGLGLNARQHWAKRSKGAKAERESARLLMPQHPVPCTVLLTRVSPGTLDDDNLRGSLKAVRDGIAERLGVVDNSPLVRWEYAQQRARAWGVKVSVKAGIDGEPRP